MIITIEYLTEAFKKYNTLYFDNELPMPDKFKIGRGVQRLGCFQTRGRFPYQKTSIMVSQYNGLRTQQDIDHTLIHEMIHLWQWNYHYTDTHGESFKRKAWDIHLKSKGEFNITTTHNGVRLEATATAANLPQMKTSQTIYVCAVYNKKNNYYMLVGSSNVDAVAWKRFFLNYPESYDLLGWWESNDKDLLKLNRNRFKSQRYKFRKFVSKNDFLLFAREKKLNFLVKSLENQN